MLINYGTSTDYSDIDIYCSYRL